MTTTWYRKLLFVMVVLLSLTSLSISYASPVYKYEYDAKGNLIKVKKIDEQLYIQGYVPPIYKTFDHLTKQSIAVPQVSRQEGGMTTIQFWMIWNGFDDVMPFSWNNGYTIWINSGFIGFNTASGDLFGVPVGDIANRWVLITAVFSNGDITKNKLYINGELKNLKSYMAPSQKLYVTTEATPGGWSRNDVYRYGGQLAEFRAWNKELTQGDIWSYVQNPGEGILQGGLVDEWIIFDNPPTSHAFKSNSGYMLDDLPVNQDPNGKTTVQFWMKWNGDDSQMPFSWNSFYSLYFLGALFGFNTDNGDTFGVVNHSLVHHWVHVTAIFANDNIYNSELYINGQKQDLIKSGNANSRKVSNSAVVSGRVQDNYYRFKGQLYQLKIWNRALTASEITNEMYNSRTTANYVDFEG